MKNDSTGKTELVVKWDFTTDWKPEPIQLAGWEPVFHAVLANGSIYVPGAGGTLFRPDRGDGTLTARINPFGTIDANTFVAGPPTADNEGNIYYNVLRLDSNLSTIGSWLVKVAQDNTTSQVAYTTLVPDGPVTCQGVFPTSQLPWPPSPTATPADTFPCGPSDRG